MSRPRVRRTVAVRRCSARIARKRSICSGRRAVVGAGRVVGDQVDLVDAGVEQGRELAGVLGPVVDAVEHHVLDEDLAAAARPVAVAGGEHLGQRVAVVDRHQLRAQAVVGRVQGERQADRHLALGEAVDPGHPADRRDRGAPVGDAEVGQPLAGGEHRVEVHRRLPHPHEDDVVDRLDAAEVERLVEDLVGGQVAAELHLAGGAEGAGQRAARLRGDADRAPAVAVAHQDRLDRAAVGGVEERLDRAVVGLRLRLEGQGRERDLGGEPLPQRPPAGWSSPRRNRRRAPPTPRPGRHGRRARRLRRELSRSARDPLGECRRGSGSTV